MCDYYNSSAILNGTMHHGSLNMTCALCLQVTDTDSAARNRRAAMSLYPSLEDLKVDKFIQVWFLCVVIVIRNAVSNISIWSIFHFILKMEKKKWSSSLLQAQNTPTASPSKAPPLALPDPAQYQYSPAHTGSRVEEIGTGQPLSTLQYIKYLLLCEFIFYGIYNCVCEWQMSLEVCILSWVSSWAWILVLRQ